MAVTEIERKRRIALAAIGVQQAQLGPSLARLETARTRLLTSLNFNGAVVALLLGLGASTRVPDELAKLALKHGEWVHFYEGIGFPVSWSVVLVGVLNAFGGEVLAWGPHL